MVSFTNVLVNFFRQKQPDGPITTSDAAAVVDDKISHPEAGADYELNPAAVPQLPHANEVEVGQDYQTPHTQNGVKVAEAISLSWSRKSLVAAYLL